MNKSTLSPYPPERCFEDPVSREETKQKFDRRIREKDDVESQREQIIWRLERLLGDTCDEGRMAGETHPPSDSICTEDFDRRFRDEMVEFTLPESNMQQPSKADNAERAEITESDTCQHETKEHSVPYVDAEGTATTQKSSKGTVTTHYSQSEKPCRTEGLEKYMSEMFKVHISGSERARERHKTPQGIHDDGDSSKFFFTNSNMYVALRFVSVCSSAGLSPRLLVTGFILSGFGYLCFPEKSF